MQHVKDKAAAAKSAAHALGVMGIEEKNKVLRSIAAALRENSQEILKANENDLENGRKAGTKASLLDRLALSQQRIEGMAQGLEKVALLPDPIGEVINTIKRP